MSPEVVIKIPEEPDIRGEFIDSGVWEGPQMHLKTHLSLSISLSPSLDSKDCEGSEDFVLAVY